jgi:glutaconate CoA-transferase subunit B
LCQFLFDRNKKQFLLKSIHQGHSLEEVHDNTGFDFEVPETIPITAAPTKKTLTLIREKVAPVIADPYPDFAKKCWPNH